MGRLFDSPLTIVLILVVILLLFGAPKLPGMARSLGQSMRIFKSEVKEMKKDGEDDNVTVNGQPVRDGQNISQPQHPTTNNTVDQANTATGQPAAQPTVQPNNNPADPQQRPNA